MYNSQFLGIVLLRDFFGTLGLRPLLLLITAHLKLTHLAV